MPPRVKKKYVNATPPPLLQFTFSCKLLKKLIQELFLKQNVSIIVCRNKKFENGKHICFRRTPDRPGSQPQ